MLHLLCVQMLVASWDMFLVAVTIETVKQERESLKQPTCNAIWSGFIVLDTQCFGYH